MTQATRTIPEICQQARGVRRQVALLSDEARQALLRAVASELRLRVSAIVAENALDCAKSAGESPAFLDRLLLTEPRVLALAASVDEVAALPSPLGAIGKALERPNGILVSRTRVPLGVIAMIYESRPNVTIDAFALSFRAGNVTVLRGGKEAMQTNVLLANIVQDTLEKHGLPRQALSLIDEVRREAIAELVRQEGLLDLVIPRGGTALIRYVTEHTRVPVVQHYRGVCHVYLDATCDAAMARKVVCNAKMSRTGVCNAAECLLVHQAAADRVLPALLAELEALGCEVRGCERTQSYSKAVKPALAEDFGEEFLAPILAVRVVPDMDAAMEHIAQYGSEHTECIVTESEASKQRFLREVDAACVVANASTRFHDGGELGLGAEIGIATSRLHWRGPMGLESLTTMKWNISGNGHTR
jgi:glutamate-5-semialdehyde dehydrogenase